MKRKWMRSSVIFFCLIAPLFANEELHSCTDFQLIAEDYSIINARTMEFGIFLNSEVIIHPRNETRSSSAPNGKVGLTWKSKYGLIGTSALGMDIIVDGFNEMGLSFGALWFPSAKYQDVLPKEYPHSVAIEDLGLWILGNFATVTEVKDALKKVRIWGHRLDELGGEPPLHIALHDLKGQNMVIEFINGKVNIYENPAGTLTNYPALDWHLINLQNYVNLTSIDRGPINYHGTILGPTGHGSGLLGIPGDWTPPSRFVRTTVLKQFAAKPKTVLDAINLSEHLLNAVDIPRGTIRSNGESAEGDYTQWCVIKDLTNKVFYFRTYKDLTLRAVDLKKVNLGENGIKLSVSMDLYNPIVDITQELHEIMPSVQSKTSP